MQKAIRWMKGLLCMNKTKGERRETAAIASDKKIKKNWSPVNPGRANSLFPGNNIPGEDIALSDVEREHDRQAIAVIVASAAAADAAMAAAQAAAALVRLSPHRRAIFSGERRRETLAAIKIQSAFRGYLARKARRALTGVVKLQALVRGLLVRRHFATMVYSMQAISGAKSAAGFQHAHPSLNKWSTKILQTFQSLARLQAYVRSISPRTSLNKENIVAAANQSGETIRNFDSARSEFYGTRPSTSRGMTEIDRCPQGAFQNAKCKLRTKSARSIASFFRCSRDSHLRGVSESLQCPFPPPTTTRNMKIFAGSSPARKIGRQPDANQAPPLLSRFAPVTPSKSVNGDYSLRPHFPCPNHLQAPDALVLN